MSRDAWKDPTFVADPKPSKPLLDAMSWQGTLIDRAERAGDQVALRAARVEFERLRDLYRAEIRDFHHARVEREQQRRLA